MKKCPKYVLLLKGKRFDNIWAIIIFDIFHPKLDEITENRCIVGENIRYL
jgi:hypothetical protein